MARSRRKGKVRGQGDAARMRVGDLRQLGHPARVSRHDIPEDQLDDVVTASMFCGYLSRPPAVRRWLSTLLDDEGD